MEKLKPSNPPRGTPRPGAFLSPLSWVLVTVANEHGGGQKASRIEMKNTGLTNFVIENIAVLFIMTLKESAL
ncbi:MAG: hypothetical protein KJ649_13190 [Proteobacteria bacterium]|nr:hypothetical protein [Pseudomonadota bacterium]MBU1745832.1 hypothetical protein [Pseudomonadota bacterium]